MALPMRTELTNMCLLNGEKPSQVHCFSQGHCDGLSLGDGQRRTRQLHRVAAARKSRFRDKRRKGAGGPDTTVSPGAS
jgi:hypothetical protein